MSGLRRVGIVGFGSVGRYLTRMVLENPRCKGRLELAFVCEPLDPTAVASDASIPAACRLERVEDFEKKGADLIVEVAHPDVSKKFGGSFLRAADYMPASTTAFADASLERTLLAEAAVPTGRGLYIPRGALWGAEDIQRMANDGSLKALTVTMKKAPHHLKVLGPLKEKLDAIAAKDVAGETVLYEGSVRGLCPLAPNNVNTIAAAALAAHNLGLDGTVGRLVVDPSLERHIVEVELEGPSKPGGEAFRLFSTRSNPAEKGAVTGDATYASFLNSILLAGGQGDGVHFC